MTEPLCNHVWPSGEPAHEHRCTKTLRHGGSAHECPCGASVLPRDTDDLVGDLRFISVYPLLPVDYGQRILDAASAITRLEDALQRERENNPSTLTS